MLLSFPSQHWVFKMSWLPKGQKNAHLHLKFKFSLPFHPYSSYLTPPICSSPLPPSVHSFYRFIADEALSTQLNIFEESFTEDNHLMEMPGAVDINSHEDMFRAVFEKASNQFSVY